jgi:hypothetical protein
MLRIFVAQDPWIRHGRILAEWFPLSSTYAFFSK